MDAFDGQVLGGSNTMELVVEDPRPAHAKSKAENGA